YALCDSRFRVSRLGTHSSFSRYRTMDVGRQTRRAHGSSHHWMIKLDGVLQWSITDPVSVSEGKTKEPCKIPCSGIEIGGGTTSALGRAMLSLIDQSRQQKISQQKGLHCGNNRRSRRGRGIDAKMHHAHKDEEEKGIKDWIRNNAEAAND